MKRIFFAAMLATIISCSSEEEVKPVQITELEFSSLSDFSVNINCDILIADKSEIQDLGIIYSEVSNVSMDKGQLVSHMETSGFLSRPTSNITFRISDLQKGIQYFINVYVILNDGTVIYGEEKSVTTLSGNRFFKKSHLISDDYNVLNYQSKGVSIDEKLYFVFEGSLYYNDLRFGDFEKLIDLPIYPIFTEHINSKLYFISGVEIYEYDLNTNNLVEKMNCPGDFSLNTTGFVIDDKLYVGTNRYWAFDPEDISNGTDQNGNALGTWSEIDYFSGNVSQSNEETSFTFDGAGYLWGNKDLYKYDKDLDSWSKVTDYPGDTFGKINNLFAFCIDGVFYTNSGSLNDSEGEIWSYNIANDTWKQIFPEDSNLTDLDFGSWSLFFVNEGQAYMYSYALSVYIVFVP